MGKLKTTAANLNLFGLPAGRDIWEAAPIRSAKWLEINFSWRPFGNHVVSFNWRSFTREANHTIELWNCPSLELTAEKCAASFGLDPAKIIQIPQNGVNIFSWSFVYRDSLIEKFSECWGGDARTFCPQHGYSKCGGLS